MENLAFIALGSNIGERFNHLEEAVSLLNQHHAIEVVNVSSVYETDPVGYEDQAPFLNMVAEIRTGLDPFSLLEVCLGIEEQLGRKREIRWGPRTIDLDILLFNQENIKSETLIVPHPRMWERAFVIVPLMEICHEACIPQVAGPSVNVDRMHKEEGVRIWKQKNGEDVFALFES
ncbi:2-amino-4-hydroxy-6-hydroxymethyldihydropteridine diphosphokinase [Mesobacillus zeae]|uniref:2-amino-4-hydroxy-6-hydroxymethyldihydropteridine diphosphokinase n=1 Tax=Mesobacillus zeae TaxID=1917180 RepID=A0A398BG11_9BACI|nr:2-amino-4-hydroxy-6-hydroxymethyldihydropteridine diphosphokinase [Mesobacillus zeae]RID88554.1 2-amino-4-hydroxy-6-hydroxymethyldihydropteridine diphosphokinase [Mesobacillus zeae]